MVGKKPRRPKRGVRQKAPGPAGLFELDIVELGHRGDGIAYIDGSAVYAPYTLPGEKIKSRVRNGRGEIIQLLEDSPQRIEPVCRYFGVCGGCDLQHMKNQSYLNWKQAQVEKALRHRGIANSSVEPPIETQAGTRRRVTFTAERNKAEFVFGYSRRARHEVIEIEDCPLLTSTVRAAMSDLRSLSEALLPENGRLSLLVTEAKNGFDLYANHFDGTATGFDYTNLEAITRHAQKSGCARLTVNDELLLSFADPQISIAGFDVSLPPGGFLQATEASEHQLQSLVVRALGNSASIVDLFCGCGTFALRLAKTGQVLAVDSSEEAVAALARAAQKDSTLKKLTTNCRDLFDEPLLAKELNRFEAVVFDPPRKGAAAQAHQIAKSDVAKVAAVSCDPGTFSRDAQILIEGGYQLDWVVPVDQFLWSHHIEIVAAFSRNRQLT